MGRRTRWKQNLTTATLSDVAYLEKKSMNTLGYSWEDFSSRASKQHVKTWDKWNSSDIFVF